MILSQFAAFAESDPNSAAKDILERVGLGGGAAKWLKGAILRSKESSAIPSLYT